MLLAIWYVVTLYILIRLGRMQVQYRTIKVSGVTTAIAVTAAAPIFFAAALASVLIWKMIFILISAIFLIISKWKIFVALKASTILIGLSATLASIFSGPLGWIAWGIVFLIFSSVIIEKSKEWFYSIYTFCIEKISLPLWYLRKISDRVLDSSRILYALFFPVEFILVTILPFYSLKEIFEFWDEPNIQALDQVGPIHLAVRFMLCGAYCVFCYVEYRRGTKNSANSYLDVPDVIDVDGKIL